MINTAPVVLGIDPGLTGGLAFLGPDGFETHSMPTIELKDGKKRRRIVDAPALVEIISVHAGRKLFVCLEKVNARPGQGVVSMFSFGRASGIVEGVVAGLRLPYAFVTPQAWMKELHRNVEGKDTKAKSQLVASRMFPALKTRHEGQVEALLIAYFARQSLHHSLMLAPLVSIDDF